MSDFLVAMSPIVAFWTLPLVPIAITGILATVETVSTSARGLGGETLSPIARSGHVHEAATSLD